MGWLKKSLLAKVYFIPFLVGAILLALSAFSLWQTNNALKEYNTLINEDFYHSQQIDYLNLLFKRQVQEWKNVLLRGHDSGDRQKYWVKFESQQQEIQRIAKELIPLINEKSTANDLNSFAQTHQQLFSKYQQAYNTFNQGDNDYKAADKQVRGIDREPSALLEGLQNKLSDNSKSKSALLASSSLTLSNSLFITTLVVLIISLSVAFLWLKALLIKPLRALSNHLFALESGNLEFNSELKPREDELGLVSKSVIKLQASLKNTTDSLKAVLQSLKQSSRSLSHISQDISRGINEQHLRTDQVATAMNEMSATAHEVAQHAANAAEAATNADNSAQSTMGIMNNTIETINDMSKEVSNTSDVIQRLEEESKSIGTVLDVIRGIAEQTNLLALNAAIEAARAGDQGRGFAVVADEVRTLAQRTQQSTAEIQDIIANVQNGAHDAVAAIERGRNQTAEGVEKVTKAGESLQTITHAVEEIRDMNQQIATAAEEQTSVAEDISQNLHEITDIASTNSKNADKTAENSHNLEDLAKQLEELVVQLAK
ncbi:methyl-accepting chemotaxis protein [Zooshikella marina]|uniref:methyl-accepting chemotaxis protein n=1 Tax=Zooshikella ganghwensis TaxID=202772 RepID=UPI001BAED7CB|nr:methyl-accepting chemotaxis protein [Zooshikella ganghwensis]MBU2707277.1 methyl-accepting chemotaxis protein [Zooshikella ganghwensis]